MKAKHTPLPWKRSSRARWVILGGGHSKAVVVARNQNGHDPEYQEADANLDLIVRTANAHGALVEALEAMLERLWDGRKRDVKKHYSLMVAEEAARRALTLAKAEEVLTEK
jgi:hypothetical protein